MEKLRTSVLRHTVSPPFCRALRLGNPRRGCDLCLSYSSIVQPFCLHATSKQSTPLHAAVSVIAHFCL